MCQLLVCVAGSGAVLVAGQWCRLEPGQAYFTPPGVMHAYRADRTASWELAWVMYARALPGLQAGDGPHLVELDADGFCHQVDGLLNEAAGLHDHSAAQAWADLVHLGVTRAVGLARAPNAFDRAWQLVDEDLARQWTAADIALLAGMSTEHLRRCCHRRFGGSAMRQLTRRRMERAHGMLLTGDVAVQEIAAAVGYGNAFAFSTAFKRWAGQAPVAFRGARYQSG